MKEKEDYIKEVNQKLNEKMEEMQLPCDIKGRYKQHYSIHQKMISQSLEFEEVYDIIAFRLILDLKSHFATSKVHTLL